MPRAGDYGMVLHNTAPLASADERESSRLTDIPWRALIEAEQLLVDLYPGRRRRVLPRAKLEPNRQSYIYGTQMEHATFVRRPWLGVVLPARLTK